MDKSLKVFFIIIVLIVLGKYSFNVLQEQKIISVNQLNAAPTPSLNPAFNPTGLSMLTYWQKGIVNSAKLTTELKGKIIKIDTNGQVEEHGWPAFNYALKIRIEGENGDSNDIFISEAEMEKTEFKKVNIYDQVESMDYKELKVNDKIQAFLVFDLTKDFINNFESAEIMKL